MTAVTHRRDKGMGYETDARPLGRTPRCLILLVAAIVTFQGTPGMADDASQQALLDDIEVLSQAKSLAESRVKLLRALVDDGELTSGDLRPLQVQYDDARARVNASFDRIVFELELTRAPEPAESFEELAQRASREVSAFLRQSNAVILGQDRSPAGVAAIEAAPGLFGSIVEIWKVLRGEKKERRAALVARVESLKWDAFDAVE